MRGVPIPTMMLALAWSGDGALADAPIFTVDRISPGLNAELARGQPVYIAVRYDSGVPLRFLAEAFANGAAVTGGVAMNAAPVQPAGSGSALVWIAFDDKAAIDEIRITAYGADGESLATLPVGVAATWTGAAAAHATAPPAWVSRLIAADAAKPGFAASVENRSGGDMLLGLLIAAAIPAYLVLQWFAAGAMQGAWRAAATTPLAVGLLGLQAALAFAAGLNLWPMTLVLAAPAAFAYVLLLALI